MKKANKIILLLIAVSAIIAFVRFFTKPAAEEVDLPKEFQLVRIIEKAIHKQEWEQSQWVQWTFMERRHFVWNKTSDMLQVKADELTVNLNLRNREEGLALKGDTVLEGERKKEALAFAWSAFCNDSFWLNAPAKLQDPGTKLTAISDTSLLVEYALGGVTPGDRYEWHLDESGLPKACIMWVGENPPAEGYYSTWEDYQETSSGALVAVNHTFNGRAIPISNLKVAESWKGLGLPENPFNK